MTLEEDKRFLCVWLLYYVSNFADSRMEVPRYRSSPASWDHFILSVFSSGEVLGKVLSLGVKCRLQPAGLGRKRGEGVKPTCFMSKATSVPQTNHSQYSSPDEAYYLIVESKSLPVELNNSTTELHVPSRLKKSLQLYCSAVLFRSRPEWHFELTAGWFTLYIHNKISGQNQPFLVKQGLVSVISSAKQNAC